ncbi:MAG TPA: ATP-binding protein [Terriglobales bacterium]|nr:ATP-binding protein [Terriglobales bacterium]
MKRRRRRKPARAGEKQEQQQAPLQPVYPEDRVDDDGGSAAEPQAEPETAAPQPQQRTGKKRRRGGRGRKPMSAASAARAAANPEVEAESPESVDAAGIEEAAEPERAPAQVPQATYAQKRQPKGTVVLTIGLPGSGKTSWFRRRGITPLSSDLLRMMLFDDIAEQRYQDLVFSTLRYLLRARMIARMPWNYVDATNLSPRERRGWIKMAQEFGYEVHAVFFDVPVEVCAERNTRRGRIVPEDVMQRMAQKLRPPTFDEGFSKITVVRVKRASKAEPEPDNEVMGVEEPGTGKAEDLY